jgi:ribosomal protein S18 acetylase RimI-like enzyme
MQLRTLPPEEDSIDRFLDELWLPYHRDLEDAVEAHALATDLEGDTSREERIEFWIDNLEPETARAWIAVEDGGDADAGAVAGGQIADLDPELVGFVTTFVDECPDVFERPDQLLIGDFYVAAEYRGSGLARQLVERAAQRAEEAGCPELTLNVDVDNERALAFYEKMGFEPLRHKLRADVEDL